MIKKAAVVIFVLIGGLTGCVENAPTAPDPLAEASTFTIPPGTINEDTGELVEPGVETTWGPTDMQAATEAARNVINAYGGTAPNHDEWWIRLAPLLTPPARDSYITVQYENVPKFQATEEDVTFEVLNEYIVKAHVPTNLGVFTALLVRLDGRSPWEMGEISFPVGVGT